MFKLADFLADLKGRHAVDPSETIRTALSIDAELISLMLSVPPAWRYTAFQVPEVDGMSIISAIWGGSYDVYKSLAASIIWNNYRSARIVIQELVMVTLEEVSCTSENGISSSQNHFLADQCRQTMIQLAEDICASVPFSLGLELECPDDMTSQEPRSNFSSPPKSPIAPNGAAWSHAQASHSPPRAGSAPPTLNQPSLLPKLPSFEIIGAGGLTLMWPLLVAANSGVASLDLRKWIASSLDKIGHSMGINQPLCMAQLLRDGMQTRSWLTPDRASTGQNG